jgi:hypothetical protein
MASSIQPETNENVSFDSNQISSDEQLTQIIDSINENTNTDEPPRTAIGAKLVKKLETLGILSNRNISSFKNPFFSSSKQ